MLSDIYFAKFNGRRVSYLGYEVLWLSNIPLFQLSMIPQATLCHAFLYVLRPYFDVFLLSRCINDS